MKKDYSSMHWFDVSQEDLQKINPNQFITLLDGSRVLLNLIHGSAVRVVQIDKKRIIKKQIDEVFKNTGED